MRDLPSLLTHAFSGSVLGTQGILDDISVVNLHIMRHHEARPPPHKEAMIAPTSPVHPPPRPAPSTPTPLPVGL